MERTTRRFVFPSLTLTETFLKDLADQGSLETHAVFAPDQHGRVKLMIVLRPEQAALLEPLLTTYEGLPLADEKIEAAKPKEVAPKPTAAPRAPKAPTEKSGEPVPKCPICKLPIKDIPKHTVKRHPSAA